MTARILLTIALVQLAVTSGRAQAPQLINYQARLDTTSGTINGQRNLTFAVYSAPSGGSALWSETQTGVTITNGVFTVLLGSATPLPNGLFTGAGDRYLGVAVGNTPELSPRFRFTSVPYTVRALQADGVADSSISARKVASGQLVRSLNGLRDSVTIAAGTGATVQSSGNTITISASGSGGGLQGVQNTDSALSITNPNGPTATINIKPAGITGPKIASGQLVRSLNGLRDSVTIAAGTGATVQSSGSTITISASGSGGGLQGVQNTDNTLSITNPNGPTATINIKPAGITGPKIAAGAIADSNVSAAGISAAKIIGMPGVQWTAISQTNIDVRTAAVNVGMVTMNLPAAGYVVVHFDGMAFTSPGDRLILAASNTSATWGPNDGSTATGGASGTLRGNFSHTRVYPVGPGSHSFYAVAQNYVEGGGNGIASIYGNLTVTYYPTIY